MNKELSAIELETGECIKGDNHTLWFGLTGDMHPQYCSKCGCYSNEAPTAGWPNDL